MRNSNSSPIASKLETRMRIRIRIYIRKQGRRRRSGAQGREMTAVLRDLAEWRAVAWGFKDQRPQMNAICSAGEAEGDRVPVRFLQEALYAVRQRSLDVNSVLREADIEPATLTFTDSYITPEQFGRFWHLVARELDDEFFCQDRRGMPSGSYTLLCHAVLHAETLDRAICRMLRFYRVMLEDFDGRLKVSDGIAEISIVEKSEPRTAFAYATFLVQFLGVACWLIDRRIPLFSAEFRGQAGADERHYRRLFCDSMKFGSDQTSIRFDAQLLKLRPHRDEAQMKRFLRDAPCAFLKQYQKRDSLAAEIWQQLRMTLPEEWPVFEKLAASLHTTPSTLRRRLEDEQVSYQKIKDSVRRERAINQLKANIKSNAEIAEELGFGDPSTFYRAFKKWTGQTPNAYRAPGHPIEHLLIA